MLGMILRGELQARQRINEPDMAARLGVSRVPVREALRELESTGLVVARKHAGVFVREPTADEVRDLYEMRGLLDGFAGRRAAHLPMNPRASLCRPLDASIAAMKAAFAAHDVQRYYRENLRFHWAIVEAAGNHAWPTPTARWWPARRPSRASRSATSCPVAAGGGSDMIARTVTERWGRAARPDLRGRQPERRRRRGRLQNTARAPADGYTLMQGYVATHGTSPATRKVPYDAIKDFTPIGMIGATPNVLVINATCRPRLQGVHRLREAPTPAR
jgi:DNA-binding GntR family transcriptional regulator